MDAIVNPEMVSRDAPVNPRPRAITLAILAMGGEGGGVLADWIVDLAEHAGYTVQNTSVPGVAQRTGSTIYYLELFPEASVRAVGREPVLALMPVPGEMDIVIASELMEAGRAIQRGLVTADRSILIASSHRVFTMTEKTAMGDGRVDASSFIAAGRMAAKSFVHGDFAHIAEETGSVISAPLFGALAGSGRLPIARIQFEDAIRRGGVGVEASLAAFAAGYALASEGAAKPSVSAAPVKRTVGPRLRPLAERIERDFPAAGHIILVAGIQRLADYQDEAYAADYLDRLAEIRHLDARHGDGAFRLLNEMGRYLALWMSYEDTIRVADLKTRRTRFERVRQEVRAGTAQVVRINEFLHPRVEEIADTLPAGLGRWLLATAWAHEAVGRFTQRGRIIQTTSLRGYLLLYAIAGMRRWRRRSLRFAVERERIAAWIGQVKALASVDYGLALEVAGCARLIKGYGDTQVRGSRNFAIMLGVIPRLRALGDAPGRLRKLRDAALADDTGLALAAALRDIETAPSQGGGA